MEVLWIFLLSLLTLLDASTSWQANLCEQVDTDYVKEIDFSQLQRIIDNTERLAATGKPTQGIESREISCEDVCENICADYLGIGWFAISGCESQRYPARYKPYGNGGKAPCGRNTIIKCARCMRPSSCNINEWFDPSCTVKSSNMKEQKKGCCRAYPARGTTTTFTMASDPQLFSSACTANTPSGCSKCNWHDLGLGYTDARMAAWNADTCGCEFEVDIDLLMGPDYLPVTFGGAPFSASQVRAAKIAADCRAREKVRADGSRFTSREHLDFIKTVARLGNANAIIINGDITVGGCIDPVKILWTWYHDMDGVNGFNDFMDDVPQDVFWHFGNHDVELNHDKYTLGREDCIINKFRRWSWKQAEHGKISSMDILGQSIATEKRSHTGMGYSFDREGIRFFMLGNSPWFTKDEGDYHITSKVDWLKKELDIACKHKVIGIALLWHIPWWSGYYNRRPKQPFIDMLNTHNSLNSECPVFMTSHGHFHHQNRFYGYVENKDGYPSSARLTSIPSFITGGGAYFTAQNMIIDWDTFSYRIARRAKGAVTKFAEASTGETYFCIHADRYGSFGPHNSAASCNRTASTQRLHNSQSTISKCVPRTRANTCYSHDHRDVCLVSKDSRAAYSNSPCVWKPDGFSSGNKCEPKIWADKHHVGALSYEDCFELSTGTEPVFGLKASDWGGTASGEAWVDFVGKKKSTVGSGANIEVREFNGLSAAHLDTDQDYLEWDIDIGPNAMPRMSLEILVWVPSIVNQRGWIFGDENGGCDRYILLHDDRVGGISASCKYNPGVGQVPTGEWVHIISTYDQYNQRSHVYKNGVGASTHGASVSHDSGNQKLRLGSPSNNHFANAWVAEVYVYDFVVDKDLAVDLYHSALKQDSCTWTVAGFVNQNHLNGQYSLREDKINAKVSYSENPAQSSILGHGRDEKWWFDTNLADFSHDGHADGVEAYFEQSKYTDFYHGKPLNAEEWSSSAGTFVPVAITVTKACGVHSPDFGDWAGSYDLVYSNGHTNTFTIGCGGLVTSVSHDGSGKGQLTPSYDSNCPGFPCMRLEGIYASGKYEFLSLTGNTLSIKHYHSGLCCTATANRVARDCEYYYVGDGHVNGCAWSSLLGSAYGGYTAQSCRDYCDRDFRCTGYKYRQGWCDWNSLDMTNCPRVEGKCDDPDASCMYARGINSLTGRRQLSGQTSRLLRL